MNTVTEFGGNLNIGPFWILRQNFKRHAEGVDSMLLDRIDSLSIRLSQSMCADVVLQACNEKLTANDEPYLDRVH